MKVRREEMRYVAALWVYLYPCFSTYSEILAHSGSVKVTFWKTAWRRQRCAAPSQTVAMMCRCGSSEAENE
jgi:hypothetical protein